MLRVRFGHVHIYNNYYNSVGNNYCIGTGVECNIRVENTYFDNVNQLWKDWKATTTGGVIGWDNLKLVDSSEPTYIANSFPVFSLPYQFDMDSVEAVKDIVMANAGNVFTTTSVDEIDHTIASEFKLFQNYPNPFNPSTNISFILAKNSHTLIKVYDILGQEIATLVNENLNAGPHTIQLNGSDLESGVYFYNIVAGNYQASKKMMLIK